MRCFLQYHIDDEVFLMNPSRVRQQVAVGCVSGLPGEHKFHFKDIPVPWVKVDIKDTTQPTVPLMYPSPDPDMQKLGDAKGTCVIWYAKNMKFTT